MPPLHIADDGVLVITIRPVEYWDLDQSIHAVADTSSVKQAHRQRGFAFYYPFDAPIVDDEVTYGNTSMTTGWIEANFPRWEVASVDRSLDDPYQVLRRSQAAMTRRTIPE